jgi:hypothetical protein
MQSQTTFIADSRLYYVNVCQGDEEEIAVACYQSSLQLAIPRNRWPVVFSFHDSFIQLTAQDAFNAACLSQSLQLDSSGN